MPETMTETPMLLTFVSLPSTGTAWTGNPEDPDPPDCEAGILLVPHPYGAKEVSHLMSDGVRDGSLPFGRIHTTDMETWKYVAERIGTPVIGVARVCGTRDEVRWYVYQKPNGESLEVADAARVAAVLEKIPQVAQLLLAHLAVPTEQPGLLLDKVRDLFSFPVVRIPDYLEAHGYDASKLFLPG